MATESGSLDLRLNVQQTITLMLEPIFTDGLLSDSFAIVKNFYGGEYAIGLLGAMRNVTGKQQACSPKYKGQATMSERKLIANYLEAGTTLCYEEFMRTHYDYLAPLYTTAQGTPNLMQLLNILITLLGDGIKRDVERVAWFGDSASTDENINFADGVFKFIDSLITTNEIGYRVNSNQGTGLSNQQAYELLQNVVRNAPTALKKYNRADRVIHINGNLWDQVLQYIEDAAISNGFIKVFEEPTGELVGTYKGIKVLAHYNWDDISEEYFSLDNQNKIIYTVKSNLVLGTDLRPDATGGSGFFKTYQDPKTDEIFMSSKFILAINYVWPELFSVAF